MANRNVLSDSNDAKTIKGEKYGYKTGILYLAPYTLSGVNLCPNADNAGCFNACLYTAGRGGMSNVQSRRLAKTDRFHNDKNAFLSDLIWSIKRVERAAKREGLTPCIRLNGTSDINWQAIKIDGLTLFEVFPHIQFYDYTKIPQTSNYKNYHLTFSYSQANKQYNKSIAKAIKLGMNIAVVFRDVFPKTFLSYNVINGDDSDLRFLDKEKSVIALRAKGKAKKDSSGFVIDGNIIPTF